MPTIPARSFAFQRLHPGQSIKIINTSGSQVIDTWAFTIPSTPNTVPRYMSMAHTRPTLQKLLPSINESFVDNNRNPILTITEDTSRGTHDVLYAACSPERYLELGGTADHDNCAQNLRDAVKQCAEPAFGHVSGLLESGWTPDPLNLFMNVEISGNGLRVLEPDSKVGDFVVLRAEQECVVFMSACPMDLTACNGEGPSSAEFEVV
ncbi:hypothetical protein BO85DRAFT_445582 [Aspergillus piperis CBS 112811]|uniref:DUF1989 domain-containing protein n=1 Tax=Aspergillus piperis CBS 112811 TaxID=1448313 RepID=A0A8G1R9N1_9EURO|nr:hypothetical protein BO85DRAFT_445582 [Aspergillus piperis CBS 112811]RAH62158.1 hypothetical protein BO85DRAFT_445582 [Aspergillus piperis CBS 112811]